VDAASRPSGLYANWQGQTFEAQRSTADGTVLLVAASQGQAPESFDQEWDNRPAKVLKEDEISSIFSLHTYCFFDDENYRVAAQNADQKLVLQWTGIDENLGRQIGLTDLGTVVAADQLSAIWQCRHAFPTETPSPTEAPSPDETRDNNALIRAIGRILVRTAAPGWQRIAAQLRQLGDYTEIEIRTDVSGGEEEAEIVYSLATPELGQLFTQLRAAMYQPGAGTWLQGTLTIQADSTFNFDFDLDVEPQWRVPPQENESTSDSARTELRRFSRDQVRIPAWLAADAELPLSVDFQRGESVEIPAGEVDFDRLPPEEARKVLHYLYRSPVAVPSQGMLQDSFNPALPPDIPDAFHTDGTWIWAASVPHYLRKYGVPPQRELLEHVRSLDFVPPAVNELTRVTAEAEILGSPRPPQSPKEQPPRDALTLANRGRTSHRSLYASEVIELLRQRLAEQGVPETAYRIGEPEAGKWSLNRTPESWQVVSPEGQLADFAHAQEAARFLLGSVLLFPARHESLDTQWSIQPFRGEPPLSLFRSKRLVLLQTGSKVLRFGDENGNLVHEGKAAFKETSLVAERERWRQEYEVLQPIEALGGITLPWGDSVGGAVAYLLPEAVGRYVESGALIKK
jgi:hypothetical protein